MIRVLFVCTGNICRSPTAEGVARTLAARTNLSDAFEFDSAGTHGYHVGEPPDPRTVAAAHRRGYDLSALRARRLTSADFARFDRIFALDTSHLDFMRQLCPAEYRYKLMRLLDLNPQSAGHDVPDPYYGGPADFEHVIDVVEAAIRALLANAPPRQG